MSDLSARRLGDHVTLSWTMPRRSTDKLPLKGPQPVVICRQIGNDSCIKAGTASFEPEKAVTYSDTLPADLASGPARLLTYSIEVCTPRGRSAGASNLALAASGEAPPAITGIHGKVQADGVALGWEPAILTGEEHQLKIERRLLSSGPTLPLRTDSAANLPLGAVKTTLPKEQSLIVRLPPTDPGRALDRDAAFDQRYAYRVGRVAIVHLAGAALEVDGTLSAEFSVDTKDTFAPFPPMDLAAAASPNEGVIDLSWEPVAAPDLAGYAVYRRDPGGGPRRISPATLLKVPAFRDTAARPGSTYTYSVTAIDQDGNESTRSAEATELLPARP